MTPKDKKFGTWGSRYGNGTVHLYVYDSLNKLWHCSCRNVARLDPHGRIVNSNSEVTCKLCLRNP